MSNHFSEGSVAFRDLLVHLRSQLGNLCWIFTGSWKSIRKISLELK